MGVEDDPGRETRQHDQEAIDELRRLHERERETSHLGQVTEHDEPPEDDAEETQDA